MFALQQPTARGYKRPPVAVKTSQATILRTEHVFSSGIHRLRDVYLFGGRDRVISIRPEYCDHNYTEHGQVVMYRANVFNRVTKQTYFVDLTPAQVLRVVG